MKYVTIVEYAKGIERIQQILLLVFSMAYRFIKVRAMDFGELEGRKFLVIVDMATNYAQGVWIKYKTPKEIVKNLLEKCICSFDAPRKFWVRILKRCEIVNNVFGLK